MAVVKRTFTTKAPKADNRTITLEVMDGETVKEDAELHGEDVVHGIFIQKADVARQNFVRPLLEAGKTDEEIRELFKKWKLGVPTERTTDPKAKAMRLLNKIDPAMAALFEKMMEEKLAAASGGQGEAPAPEMKQGPSAKKK